MSCCSQLPNLADEDVLLSELAIVDLTLTASLVVIVFLSGYYQFRGPGPYAEGRRAAALDR